jgi:hypothetical protein
MGDLVDAVSEFPAAIFARFGFLWGVKGEGSTSKRI